MSYDLLKSPGSVLVLAVRAGGGTTDYTSSTTSKPATNHYHHHHTSMSQSLLKHVAQSSLKKTLPVIEAGMTVRVSQKIKEGDKERLQAFEGLVIATDGGTGINATFTVRKTVEGVGVEKIFPLHGKTTPKIEVIKHAKVRRSKLYYMRELSGKAARLKEKHMAGVVYDEEPVAPKAPKAKAAEAATEATPA